MTIRLSLMVAAMVAVGGCASSSPTEETYGDAVRSIVAAQRIEPQQREREPSTDGARIESVMTIYRTWVGDPLPVSKQRSVEGQ